MDAVVRDDNDSVEHSRLGAGRGWPHFIGVEVRDSEVVDGVDAFAADDGGRLMLKRVQ